MNHDSFQGSPSDTLRTLVRTFLGSRILYGYNYVRMIKLHVLCWNTLMVMQ